VTDAHKTTAEKRTDPPRSFEQFLTDPTTRASALIDALVEGIIPLSATDIAAATKLSAETAQTLGRVAELIKAAKRAPTPIRNAIVELAISAVRLSAGPLKDWSLDPDVQAPEALTKVVEWAKGPLAGKDKAGRARAEAVLSVALALNAEDRSLDPLKLIALVGSAYSVAPASNETDQRPARAALKLVTKSKPRQIANLATVAALQTGLLVRTEASADRATLRAARLEDNLATAKTKIEQTQAALENAQEELAQSRRDNADLRQELEGAERRGAHGLNDIKARYRRVFTSDFLPVAADAVSALEIAPPRPDFARDYLATLIEKITKELQWLNTSSG
jgi:molecular chaperone GrpE (heat shock protein)